MEDRFQAWVLPHDRLCWLFYDEINLPLDRQNYDIAESAHQFVLLLDLIVEQIPKHMQMTASRIPAEPNPR